ncbi:MAG TPA: phage holin family protein [Parvibaculum sp.]|uniref:phage holin family protein n=1 Tax=Parvibaculum sp. TaxID=2024848 RepID=UPI002CEA1A86|nr:phage holin family protein [Parvibaculum sp.]HMM15900.1 phage holin family protein [Parvibaculum sp.]
MLDPTPNMRRLAEAELLRAEIEAKRFARRATWLGLGALFVTLAIIMLVLAAYSALSQIYGPAWAAAIMGGVLVVLAAIALLLGASKKEGRAARLEMELANRAVEDARREIRRDFEILEKRLDELSMGLLGLVRGSAQNLPILTLILGALAALSPALRRIIMPFLKKD